MGLPPHAADVWKFEDCNFDKSLALVVGVEGGVDPALSLRLIRFLSVMEHTSSSHQSMSRAETCRFKLSPVLDVTAC